MRVYGNIMNRVHESIQSAAPKIGDGATIFFFSDRHAATVITVEGNAITVQYDKVTRMDKNGQSETQDWRCEPDADGKTEVYTLRKNGQYVKQGDAIKNGTVVRFGERDHYYDFSF